MQDNTSRTTRLAMLLAALPKLQEAKISPRKALAWPLDRPEIAAIACCCGCCGCTIVVMVVVAKSALRKRYQETGDPNPQALWEAMRAEAAAKAAEEPILGSYFHATILNHQSFGGALSFRLASKLDNPMLPTMLIRDVIAEALAGEGDILASALVDITATYRRDPACEDLSTPFLFYKGFHALQAHRVAHWLWQQGRHTLALFFQSQISVGLGVDIHPAAQLGRGILIDHATGIVIGETAVVEDDVSILHSVTLGGSGKVTGDRHPKVRRGVLLGAGCKVIGNIEIGAGAKVGAGSVVLADVPAHVTVTGVPAKVVGTPKEANPAFGMDHSLS